MFFLHQSGEAEVQENGQEECNGTFKFLIAS